MKNMNTPNIQIETGGLTIIASGSGITFSENADFSIDLNFNDFFKFSVCFNFQNDKSKNVPDFNITTDKGKNVINISCFNFNDVSEVGISKPLNIATYQNKKIYMKFCVKILSGNENREILYCFYMEKDK